MSHPLGRRLRRWFQPTLVGRLMLAQTAVFTLLWVILTAVIFYQASRNYDFLRTDATYDAVLVIAENLADFPERQQETLRMAGRAIRETPDEKETSREFGASLMVWQGDRLLYKPDDLPEGIRTTRLEEVETVRAGGHLWNARTRQSKRSDTRVTLVTSADQVAMSLSAAASGFYFFPLLICLPLLLPAWLSVRLALRPWRQVSKEISSRNPRDLRALSFQPRHKELRPMVQAVNTLLQRVSESTRREHSFVADAAHELRTPLAAMRVNAEALQNLETSPRQRELLDNLLRSNDRATRLVSQLLTLVRSDTASSAAVPRRLDLDAVLQDRLAALSDLADTRGLELELESTEATFILGERESLTSLIDNLIENAIKYSPEGGAIVVRLAQQDGQAVLTVADQGPGIAPELRTRVFDRFFRAPDQTQSGSGLGLAIVKSAIDQHHGDIVLDDAEDGHGLRVTLRIPLAPEPW